MDRKFPTLSEFFESHFKPMRIEALQRDEKTLTSYYESLGHWKKLSGDPTIDQVTDLTAAKLIADLSKARGKSPGSTMKRSSIQKHVVSINSILQLAGPKSRHNRKGQNIIPEPPFFEAPKVDKTPPRKNWTVAEVRTMYAACDKMTKPKIDGIEPAAWWRALVTGLYFLGLRITAFLNLTWSMVKGEWLEVAAEISKGDKASRHFIHPEVITHFERIRRPDCDRIIEFPKWNKSKASAYELLREMQAHAEIAVERRWGFHSFRKTHTTVLASLALDGNQAIELASRSANHADTSITTSFYIGEDVQDRLMKQAIMRMPSPCGDAHKVEVKKPMDRIVSQAVEYEREFID